MKKGIILYFTFIILLMGCSPVENIETNNELPPVHHIAGVSYEGDFYSDLLKEKKEFILENDETEFIIEVLPVFNQLKPIAAMIDNHVMARPQSALSQAKIVYEILAEGPITRYMILLDQDSLVKIGPIRSARPYFIAFAMEYDAFYVHAGGSGDALTMIKNSEIDNLNGLSAGKDVFWRESHRSMPHNLYTSTSALFKDIKRLKYSVSLESPSTLEQYSGNIPLEESLLADEITVTYKKPTNSDPKGYVVKYIYNSEITKYERYINNERQVDETDKESINAGNVIIQFINHHVIDLEGRRKIDIVGSGLGYFFSMGRYIPITWKKLSMDSPTLFKNEDNEKIILNPGKLFIQVIEYNNQLFIKGGNDE